MWRTAALIDGVWHESEPLVIEDALPSLAQARALVETRMSGAENLVEHIRQEEAAANAGRFVAWHDAIARWSALAVADVSESTSEGQGELEALGEALAYRAESTATPTKPPDTIAWHDHTEAIIPIPAGAAHITIDYTPSTADESRVERYKGYGGPDHEIETILDTRAYYGMRSAVVDYWTTMRRQGWSLRASVKGISGFMAARVLRRVTVKQPTLKNDPIFAGRLTGMSDRHPVLAANCPDLSELTTAVGHDDAIVFVHGTVSTALQSLKDLCPGGAFNPQIYRYEHDTFLPVGDNAKHLAELIQKRLRARRLILAAHSRGGLVARVAADLLRLKHYPGDIHVETFGTPHEGTPLADAGGRFLNLAYKLGCEMIGSIPAMSPAVAAFSYVINCPQLPPGIDVMREESPELEALNLARDQSRTRCWGSRFDIARGPSGFGTFVTGALAGMMSGIDHDLVVPAASALAFGRAEPLLDCSHVNYFSHPAVLQALSAATAAPPVVVRAAAAGIAAPGDAPDGAASEESPGEAAARQVYEGLPKPMAVSKPLRRRTPQEQTKGE